MKLILFLNLSILVLAIAVDQFSKNLADSIFTIVKNQGLLFNTLEDLPMKVKVISLATASGILFFFYLTLLYLLNLKLKIPRLAMSLLMGGIMSNTLDKIVFGYTKDFIPLGPFAFNLADVMTMGATVFLLAFLLRFHEDIWASNESRRSILVNPHAQLMFGVKYAVVSLCTSLLMGIFAYTFIKDHVLPVVLVSSQKFMSTFLVIHITLTLLFGTIVFILGIIVSHRFVGPIVALERFVEGLNQGKEVSLNLRQGDYFKQLEELSRKINEIKKGTDLQ